MDLKTILSQAIEQKASDILIIVGMPPIIRIDAELIMLKNFGDVEADHAQQMIASMLDDEQMNSFNKNRDADFSITGEDGIRFRVNAHYQKGSLALAMRLIKSTIPDIESLGLPPMVRDLAYLPRGLVLVTGPTGSGKSTTLASIVEEINRNQSKHIITIEDPIEYDFTSNASIIEQREIGTDCPSFASGLRHALRQDPDVILVGEMRDLETTSATITAAETGHLVFSTLHTVNASRTVERIIDIYPANQQTQIRTMLANTLQAVVSQTLLQRADQPGMIPAIEIMICNSAVRNCIRDSRVCEIPNIIETGQRFGMQSLDQSIGQMLSDGYISPDQALAKCQDATRMQNLCSANPADWS
ncbi:MAG TPA: type IV pilus twitching motility protein PilT [Sedimentisphaerales bacterium]|nr:type IV pilus twitching motility protein PilT [Sedimentisphaerales bacterium]